MGILEQDQLRAPATKAQEKFWDLAKIDPLSNVDNIALCVPLGTMKDSGDVQYAFNELVFRHEALRTTFRLENGLIDQLISSTSNIDIMTGRVFDDVSQARSDDEFIQQLREAVEEPFDNESGPLARAFHIRFRNIEDALLIVVSHIVSDGWSSAVIEREIREIIDSAETGRGRLDEPPGKQFRAIAVEQRCWQNSSRLRRQHDYWIAKVADFSPTLSFPLRAPRDSIARETKGSLPLYVSTRDWQACRELAAAKRVPLSTVPLTALVIALAEFTESDHVVLGQIYCNRARKEDKDIVGLLANGLPMRFNTAHNPRVETLIKEVCFEALQSMSNGEFPMEHIADETGYGRGVTGGLPPMWEVAVNFIHPMFVNTEGKTGPASSLLDLLNSSTRRRPKQSYDGKYIELLAFVDQVSISADITYNADAVTDQDMKVLTDRISQIIESMPRLTETPISNV